MIVLEFDQKNSFSLQFCIFRSELVLRSSITPDIAQIKTNFVKLIKSKAKWLWGFILKIFVNFFNGGLFFK